MKGKRIAPEPLMKIFDKIDKDKKMIAKQVHELFEDKMFEMNDLVDSFFNVPSLNRAH